MAEIKTVLITGSTSGIGLGIAKAFAQTRKYNLITNGLEADGDVITAELGKEYTIQTMFSAANLLHAAELRALVEEGVKRFGRIDVLINNAGIQHVSPIEDFPDDKWTDIININLNAAFHLVKAVWTSMKANNFGRIINIASAHGLRASPFKSAYVASKHGLIGFTKSIALEGAGFNVTANAICPGYVKTPLVDQQITAQAAAHKISEEDVIKNILLAKQAVKDFVPVELIANMALFMASEEAATLTGSAISLDGGWTAQ
jgi:3-hydroxybutyrate dehydrogenase